MNIRKVEKEIEEEIKIYQVKLNKREELKLNKSAVNQCLGIRNGLEMALEIIRENK